MDNDDFLKQLLERAEGQLADQGLERYQDALEQLAKMYQVTPFEDGVAVRIASKLGDMGDIDDSTLDDMLRHIALKLGMPENGSEDEPMPRSGLKLVKKDSEE